VETQQDFKELLELFNSHGVDYIIVGSYALAYYGAPRYTGDIDLFVRPDKKNAEKIMKALDDFGFGSLDISAGDFSMPNKVIQLGRQPVRIDIMTSLSGVTWDESYAGRVEGKYGDITVHYIGREQFIKNKRSIGRLKDLADIEAINEV